MNRKRERENLSKIQRNTTDLIFVTILMVFLFSWTFGVFHVHASRKQSFPELLATNSSAKENKTITPGYSNPSAGRKKRPEVSPFAKCFKYTKADRLSCYVQGYLINTFEGIAVFSISLLVSATVIIHGSKHLIRIVRINLILIVVVVLYYTLDKNANPQPYKCICEDFDTNASFLVLIFFVLTFLFLIVRSDLKTLNAIGYISDLFRFRYLIVIGSFFMTTIIFLLMWTFKSLALSSLKSVLFYVISISSLYLVNFTYYFGRATISSAYISWRHSNHKSDFTLRQTFRCVGTIARYHLGTVAFSATFILPMWVALYFVRRHNFRLHRSIMDRTLDVVLMAYCILDNAEYSILVTAMYGQNFFESSKVIFHVFSINVWKSLRSLLIHHGFHILSIICTSLFSLFVVTMSSMLNPDVFLGMFTLHREPAQLFWSSVIVVLILLAMSNNITRDSFLQTEFIYSSKNGGDPIILEDGSERAPANEVAETQFL